MSGERKAAQKVCFINEGTAVDNCRGSLLGASEDTRAVTASQERWTRAIYPPAPVSYRLRIAPGWA